MIPHPSIAARSVSALELGLERTLEQDVAYGFRMLVDMAERALSESAFLDPTTAVQCIDRIHDGLRQLGVRVIPDGRHLRPERRPPSDDARHGLGRLRPPQLR